MIARMTDEFELVAVGDDVDCVLHEIPLYFWTLNKLVVEPASTSPESQFSTTLALVNPTLPLPPS